MTRHARHLLRMRRMAARRRRASWWNGLRMAVDMALKRDSWVTMTLTYRDGKWWPV